MNDDVDRLRELRPDRVLPDDPPDPEVLAREKSRLMSAIGGAHAGTEKRRGPSIYPRLAYRNEAAALEFLTRAFGLSERREARREHPDGMLAWLEIGDGVVMIGRAGEDHHGLFSPLDAGVTTAMVNVYVADIDAHLPTGQGRGCTHRHGARGHVLGRPPLRGPRPRGPSMAVRRASVGHRALRPLVARPGG
jgi:uncharacterized glyoxalase superfamily protein PhnB